MSKLLTVLILSLTLAACSEKHEQQTNELKELSGALAEKTAEVAKAEMSETANQVSEHLEQTTAAAKTISSEFGEKTQEIADAAKEKTSEASEKLIEKAKEVKQAASEKMAPEINKEAMLSLAISSGCMACHKIDQKSMGPAWSDVAKKYADQADAKSKLVTSISKGSVGKWGAMPMPANAPRVKDADISQLADFVLSLK